MKLFKRLRDRIENAAAAAVGAAAGIVIDVMDARETSRRVAGTVSFAQYERVRAEWQRAHDALRRIDQLVQRARLAGTNVIAAPSLEKCIREGLAAAPVSYGVTEGLNVAGNFEYRSRS